MGPIGGLATWLLAIWPVELYRICEKPKRLGLKYHPQAPGGAVHRVKTG